MNRRTLYSALERAMTNQLSLCDALDVLDAYVTVDRDTADTTLLQRDDVDTSSSSSVRRLLPSGKGA